ncbi:MAG: F0F1 ATP synthase subunit B [Candidatus Planktophila sp.]|jgi:F-type H+-transporting ATPase subunit b|nr:F0F1 ATP synthase subunit B [Candidatus Planktophila sp.]
MQPLNLLAGEALNPLIPHTAEVIVGFIAFTLLFLVLKSKVVPMFEKAYAARTEAIQGGIERAEKAQLEAQRALVQYNEQLSSAQGEAAKLREDARAQGAAILEELRTKAQDEAARITAAAHASIEAERQQAITSLRNEVGALAVELASKIVGEALDDQARQSRIVDRFIEDLEKSQQSK